MMVTSIGSSKQTNYLGSHVMVCTPFEDIKEQEAEAWQTHACV